MLFKRSMNFILVLLVLLCLFMTVNTHAKASNSDLLERFKENLQSDVYYKRKLVYDYLYQYSGITDESVYDLVAENAKRVYPRVIEGIKDRNYKEADFAIKALGASSNGKYLSLLSEINQQANNENVRILAGKVINRYSDFNAWNELSKDVDIDSPYNSPSRVELYKKVLSSNDQKAKIIVFRKIFDFSGITDKDLFDQIKNYISDEVYVHKMKNEDADTVAWALKALGASGNSEYEAFLNKLAKNKKNKRPIRRHARKALENIPVFAEYHKAEAQALYPEGTISAKHRRWFNLYNSGIEVLRTEALRRATIESDYNPEFKKLIVERMKKLAATSTTDHHVANFISWGCIYLVLSGEQEDMMIVGEVKKNNTSKRVARNLKQLTIGL